MITHDMHLMLEYAQRAIVFSGGQVIADDTSANILTNPDIISRAHICMVEKLLGSDAVTPDDAEEHRTGIVDTHSVLR